MRTVKIDARVKLRSGEDMTSRSAEVILKSYSPEVQAEANNARRLLLKLLPGAEESVDPSAAVLSYGYDPGYRGMVCTLILSKSGVKLGTPHV